MSGIRQLLEKRSDGSSEGDEGTQNGINVVLSAWRSNRESAGGFLTPHSSLQIAAVWAAVRLISETIASLPLFVYQETNGVKNRARDHYLYSLLHDSPNPVNTAMEMREIMQAACSCGEMRMLNSFTMPPDESLRSGH